MKAVAAPERIRLEFVDGLRALAALFVALSHAWTTIPGGRDIHGTLWLRQGRLAVDLFMVLSGFCLALPLVKPASFGILRSGALDFYKRRARRILPPYYCALALSVVLIWTVIGHNTGTHWDEVHPLTWKNILAHLLMAQDVICTNKINYAFWSIALEWQIYFLLPLIALGWRRIGAAASTLIIAVVAYGADQAALTLYPGNNLSWQLGYIVLFALGMVAALIGTSPEARYAALRRPAPWAASALLLTLASRYAVVHDGSVPRLAIIGLDLVFGLFSASILVLACCPGRNLLRNALSVKPLVFLGTYAYSIYLVHAPLLQIVWQYGIYPLRLGWKAQFAVLILVGMPVILAVCYLFFLGCEKPWLARRPNESMRKLAQDAAASPAP